MKKKLFSFVLAIFLILPCIILSGCNIREKYTLQNINNEAYENMPIVEINTQNKVLPYNKKNYINCSFKISNCDNDEYNFEVEMKDKYGEEDSVGIRLRGNSTRYMPKKPYRIKFDNKKSLFGLEKNKSWVLLLIIRIILA